MKARRASRRRRRVARVADFALAVALVVATGACSRGDTRGRAAQRDSTLSSGLVDSLLLPPPPPTGPQVGISDSMMHRLAPRLEEWAAMWRRAQPGFEIDSLFIADLQPAFKPGHVQPYDASGGPAFGDPSAVRILAEPSPNGRYRLVFDAYQFVGEVEGRFEIGGEPDSAPLLLDDRMRTSSQFEFCGTGCGFHWGTWLSNDLFALGGWQEADDQRAWFQGFVRVYSIADKTCTTYVTRIVPAADFVGYRRAWEAWVEARYRAHGLGMRA